MTSAINPATISITFPIAGQDNDSQGFRNNFASIASNFTTAQAEITALQSNTLLSADLATSTTPVVNNLLGSTISNGLYQQFSGTVYNASGVGATASIDLAVGAVQKFTLATNSTLTFRNWPAYAGKSVFSKAIVIVASDGNGVWTPTFATQGGQITYDTNFPRIAATGVQGFSVGGEGVASIVVSPKGTGYLSTTAVGFTGGSPITGSTVPTATANYTVVNASVNNIAPASLATSGASSNVGGNTATLTFAAQTITTTYPTGSTIIVSGVSPSGYNGVWVVSACTATSVSYACTQTGSQTQSGTIIAGRPGNGYAIGDKVVLNQNTSVVLTVDTLATTFTGTVTGSNATVNNVYNFTNLVTGMAVIGQGIDSSTTINTINPGNPGSIVLSKTTLAGATGNIVITYSSTTGPIGTFSTSDFPAGVLTSPVIGLRGVTSITGSGSGAQVVLNCGVNEITVTNPGDGYTTTPPSVTLTGGGGSGANATATLATGTASRVQVVEAWTVNGGTNVYLRYLGQY
jgi:hypothetical protein